MNSYEFPLGTDHLDYDATRVAADLRAQRGSDSTTGRARRQSVGTLLGSVIRHTMHHDTAAHTR